MATNYPTSLDNLTNPTTTNPVSSPSHAGQHINANDAIEAIQTKVGADSSAVNTTHDFKLSGVSIGDKSVSLAGAETLTNKTLTSPILNTPAINATGIKDTDGNETIETPAAASAVNQVEVKNSATGDDVEVNAAGGDTDINISIKGKGAGKVKLGDADIEVPNVPGGASQVLTTDGAGVTSWTDKASIAGVPEIKASNYLLAKAQTTPDLTLQVALGSVYFSATLVEYAGGNSPEFTAPTTHPRIDILSINSSGTLVRTAGDEDPTPTAPAVPAGEIPIAQVYNQVGQTSIKDTDDSTNGYVQKDLRGFLQKTSGWSLVDEWTYSTGVTEVDFTSLPPLDSFLVVASDMTTALARSLSGYVSEDNGSTFLTTDKYSYQATTLTSRIPLMAGTASNTSTIHCTFFQINLCTTSGNKIGFTSGHTSDDNMFAVISTAPVNALRVSQAENITGGTIKVYGWY